MWRQPDATTGSAALGSTGGGAFTTNRAQPASKTNPDGLTPAPNATPDEVIGKVVHLRQHYHFGPLEISMYFKRYHDLDISQSGV